MLKIQSLASGSRGNSILVCSDETKILVDVGVSLPVLLKRLEDAMVYPDEINAIVVTHEHSDHIYGVARFAKKFGVPLYIPAQARGCFMDKIGHVDERQIHIFDKAFYVGNIFVDYFPVPHDSMFCFGYSFAVGDAKISVATDLGVATDETLFKMANSQIVLLECNHDLVKLSNNTKYPSWLKRRISGNRGHLSNIACGDAISKLAGLGVQQVILAHLSSENNSPTLAYSTVKDFLAKKGLIEGQDISIDIALQDKVSNVFQVD